MLRRIRELEALWDACEQITRQHRLAFRTVGALVDAARGWRLRRSLYVSITKATAGEDISDAVATSDWRRWYEPGCCTLSGRSEGAPTDRPKS